MSRSSVIKGKLEAMKGKTFQYAKNIHYVESYTVDETEQKFTIKTNISSISRLFDSFDAFIGYWTPATQVNEVIPIHSQEKAVQVIEAENALADQMIDILKDNIKKVQESPGYIDQAKAINNNVNSIINIAKLKMQFIKESKKGAR